VMGSIARVSYGGYIALEYIWTEWMHCNEVDNVSEIIQLRNLLRDRGGYSKADRPKA
jgi:hypothetical protein